MTAATIEPLTTPAWLAVRLEAEIAAHDGVQPLTSVPDAWTRVA